MNRTVAGRTAWSLWSVGVLASIAVVFLAAATPEPTSRHVTQIDLLNSLVAWLRPRRPWPFACRRWARRPRQRQRVSSVGHPDGSTDVRRTNGRVEAISPADPEPQTAIRHLIRTDVPIRPGSSGTVLYGAEPYRAWGGGPTV